MTHYARRLARLEVLQQRQHPEGDHFISVVEVPPEADPADFLVQIACPCGAGPDCAQKEFGLVVSARCQTAEEWRARYSRHPTFPTPTCMSSSTACGESTPPV
jgi:hypothetical protein